MNIRSLNHALLSCLFIGLMSFAVMAQQAPGIAGRLPDRTPTSHSGPQSCVE